MTEEAQELPILAEATSRYGTWGGGSLDERDGPALTSVSAPRSRSL